MVVTRAVAVVVEVAAVAAVAAVGLLTAVAVVDQLLDQPDNQFLVVTVPGRPSHLFG